MQEYVCTVCGAVFEEVTGYHNRCGCKYCGNDVEPLQYCELCKKPVLDSKYKYHLCGDCEEKTRVLFRRFRDGLDSEYQLALLEEETDGVYWKDF